MQLFGKLLSVATAYNQSVVQLRGCLRLGGAEVVGRQHLALCEEILVAGGQSSLVEDAATLHAHLSCLVALSLVRDQQPQLAWDTLSKSSNLRKHHRASSPWVMDLRPEIPIELPLNSLEP